MAGNGLVEESYICKLLEGGSLDTLKESGLRDEMFLTCKDQIQFIQKHEAEYKQLPDKMIFLQKFKDFQMLEVTESMDYLADRIKEQFLYTKLVPIVQEGGNLLREDSLKAYDYLRAALETLQKDNPVSKNREGVDIISSAKDRLSSYLKRCDMKGLMGIPTGLTQLDDITNGWLFGEELVIITGRTNVGKSWIAEFFGTVAWEAGYKILQYSGEMSVEMVGFRFDTLHKHFSNMGLLNGSGILGKKEGSDGAKLLQDDYKNYISQLSTKSGYVIVTPDDFGGRKPTVGELETLAKKLGSDMIIIDQLSLMTDQRRADTPRIAYNNISEDAFLMSKRLGKPVIMLAQANREAVKNKKKGQSPELHDLAESDGVAQNATRVISLSVIDGILKLSTKKNRYGINNKDVMVMWEINAGYIKVLCDALGVWCIIAICGNNPEKGIKYRHTWNIVRINGQYYHLDATFDNTLGKNEDGSTSIRYDYFNLDDKNIFRDHEPLIAPAPPCPDGNHFYYREKKLSFTKLEDVYKRALQAAKKGREFTFHWRGGYLTREVLADLVDQIQSAGKTRDKKAIITLNWPQAVLRFHFAEQQAEGKVFIEEVNEGEKL